VAGVFRAWRSASSGDHSGRIAVVQDFPRGWLVTLGLAPRQADLFRSTAAYAAGGLDFDYPHPSSNPVDMGWGAVRTCPLIAGGELAGRMSMAKLRSPLEHDTDQPSPQSGGCASYPGHVAGTSTASAASRQSPRHSRYVAASAPCCPAGQRPLPPCIPRPGPATRPRTRYAMPRLLLPGRPRH
jgi:hypothetical protein